MSKEAERKRKKWLMMLNDADNSYKSEITL